jgi:sulfhydrogenase subunit alpha
MTERSIAVNYLARVEGEGALKVRIEGGEVRNVELRIFEPPRFFEAFLRGRGYAEAPDITARICGICPVAYQMSSCQAMESWLGLRLSDPVRRLRRALYCGEWIESHALHMFLLHLPDFLGYPDAIHLARDHRELVEQGLRIKRAGNALMTLLGGREIHPINVRVGGFYRLPTAEEVRPLLPQLEEARELALGAARFAAGLSFPDLEEDYEFVALRHDSEYPMNDGVILSSSGDRVSPERFESVYEEFQVPYSHALQSRRKSGGPYLTGPLARYALNHDRLTPTAASLAKELGLPEVVRNPFRSILVRGVEVVLAFDEALRILGSYREGSEPFVEPSSLAAGEGMGATEAPRGLLYHRYRLSAKGNIEEAKIVPPTSQNQGRIEEDLRHLVQRSVAKPDAELTELCERAVRNHDPCISCATHFLKLDLERT